MARRKSESVHVPADTAEATDAMAKYVALERDKMREKLVAQRAIDLVAEQRDKRLANLDTKAKPLFDGLKAYWEAGGRDELAEGKKSAELANAKIGVRLTTPKVKYKTKIKVADVIKWLKGLRWRRKKEFLRTKFELNRDAIIAARDDKKVMDKFSDHLSVTQVDEFFIDTGLDEDALKKEITAS